MTDGSDSSPTTLTTGTETVSTGMMASMSALSAVCAVRRPRWPGGHVGGSDFALVLGVADEGDRLIGVTESVVGGLGQ